MSNHKKDPDRRSDLLRARAQMRKKQLNQPSCKGGLFLEVKLVQLELTNKSLRNSEIPNRLFKEKLDF